MVKRGRQYLAWICELLIRKFKILKINRCKFLTSMGYQAHDVVDADKNFFGSGQHYLTHVLNF